MESATLAPPKAGLADDELAYGEASLMEDEAAFLLNAPEVPWTEDFEREPMEATRRIRLPLGGDEPEDDELASLDALLFELNSVIERETSGDSLSGSVYLEAARQELVIRPADADPLADWSPPEEFLRKELLRLQPRVALAGVPSNKHDVLAGAAARLGGEFSPFPAADAAEWEGLVPELGEPIKKQIHRLERKLNDPLILPEHLESGPVPLTGFGPRPPAPLTPPGANSWGRPSAGGSGPSDMFFGNANLRLAVEEVPVVGKALVSQGRWRKSFFWFCGFVAVNAVLSALIFWVVSRGSASPVIEASPRAREVASLDLDQLSRTLQAYVKAPDVDQRLRYVRAAGHLSAKVRRWHQTHPIEPAEDLKLLRAKTDEIAGLSFLVAEAQLLPSKEKATFLVERCPDGKMRVDWEVAVDYQDTPWADFTNARPTEPSPFRVALRPGNYYSGPFRDPSKYSHYEISYPGQDVSFDGYVEAGTLLDGRLKTLVVTGGGRSQAIVGLAFPKEKAEPKMVRITELIHDSWVINYDKQLP